VVGLAVLGLWLDSITLRIFSNLNDSMITLKGFCNRKLSFIVYVIKRILDK